MSLRIVKNNQCSLVGLTAHLLRGGGGWSLMSVYPVVRTLCLLLYLAGVIFCPPVTGGILVGKISNIFLAQLMCSAKLKHDRSLVKELSISLIPLSESLQVSTLNGTRLPGKIVCFCSMHPTLPWSLGSFG